MYDFIKMVCYSPGLKQKLLENPFLDPDAKINLATGDITYQEARYKNLKIRLYSSDRVEIAGSIHKYWNNGQHNHNDFNINNVAEVIEDLESKFEISSKDMRLENLEFGVNISLPFDPNEFLNSLVVFKKHPFDNMKINGPGKGKVAAMTQYSLKIYNKGLQYHLNEYILRYERKVVKMEYLSKEPIYLIDLLDHKLAEKCVANLLLSFEELIVTEHIDFKNLPSKWKALHEYCSNPRNWELMSAKQKCAKKQLFESLIGEFGLRKLKASISAAVQEKGRQLIHAY